MIPIHKRESEEARAILEAKQQIAADRGLSSAEAYALLNHAEKEVILDSLMKEQGHLCAYCLRRLPDERVLPEGIDPVTIEHWFPRNPPNREDRGQGLDYQNLLAVCSGNRGRRGTRKPRDLTCDAKRTKNHSQLVLNPCIPQTLDSLTYSEHGMLQSNDPAIQEDIDVKLNLNCKSGSVLLPGERKKVLDALQSQLPEEGFEEIYTYCTAALEMLEQETDTKSEYSGILIWWLKDWLQRAELVMQSGE